MITYASRRFARGGVMGHAVATMSDTTSAASTATTSTDTGRTSVVLDDGDSAPVTAATPQAATPTPPPAPGAPAAGAPKSPEQLRTEAEALVLDLGKRGRALSEREKGLTRAEAELNEYRALRQLAQTDPLGFAERVATAARLDRGKLVEAWTVNGAGGRATLTAEERVARLEADREADRVAAATRDADAAKAREEQEADQAVQQHVTSLKTLATSKAAEFPLVSRRLESSSVAAFDLMVLHHQAGQPINHEAALRLVEEQLRVDAEADAQVLGYQKGAPGAPAQPTSFAPHVTGAAPGAGAPPSGTGNGTHAPAASAGAGAAPFESAHTIRSDEDIARDWRAMFGRAA